MRCVPLLVFFGLLGLAGCQTTTVGDAGSDASPIAPDAPDLDASAGCSARATATIGPAGGTVTHCDGARLEVPAGALSAPTELSIERVVAAPPIAAPYVLAGPAFTFGPAGTVLAARANVVLPHGGGSRMEMAALVDGGWQLVEICEADEESVSQRFGALGTFVAANDPTEYPPGPSGLGEGTIDYVLGGVDGAPDLEGSLAIDYAIDEAIGDGQTLVLVFRRSDAAGLVQVDLRFGTTDAGALEAVQLAHADTSIGEIWDVLPILHPGDLTVEITTHEARMVAGTIAATLHLGERTRSFTATFRATHVEWRYPPERACEMPEG